MATQEYIKELQDGIAAQDAIISFSKTVNEGTYYERTKADLEGRIARYQKQLDQLNAMKADSHSMAATARDRKAELQQQLKVAENERLIAQFKALHKKISEAGDTDEQSNCD